MVPILLLCTMMARTRKTLVKSDDRENRTRPIASDSARPILSDESDAFVGRLTQIIGDESVSSFARRCGVGESVIRGYLTLGKRPRVDHLVSLADAGGVTVDWLATGRLPKTLTELKRMAEGAPARSLPDPDQSLLVKCMIAAEQALGRGAGIEARAALAAQLLEVIPRLDDRINSNLQMMLVAEDFTPLAQFLLLVERLDNDLYGDSDDG